MIQEISRLDDSQILLIIKQCIEKYAALVRYQDHFKQIAKRRQHTRCISVTTFPRFEDGSFIKSADKLRSPCLISKILPHELTSTIENVFNLLGERYKGTSWLAHTPKIEIHIVAIKQFWLDCYVSDENFMTLLYESLAHKIWIKLEEFTKSIENAQKTSAHKTFSLKRYDKKANKVFQIEKMICIFYLVFFTFLQFEVGSSLDKNNLFKVLCLANKKEHTQLHIWAEQFISGANKIRKDKKDSINFQEFVTLLINQI